jgi:hypothetical protein
MKWILIVLFVMFSYCDSIITIIYFVRFFDNKIMNLHNYKKRISSKPIFIPTIYYHN